MHCFQINETFVSYGPKTNKIVTLLSTMRSEKGIQSCGDNKPEIIQYYKSTTGRRDDMDQIAGYSSIKWVTPKLQLVALFNKIDISSVRGLFNFKLVCKARKVSAVVAYHISKTTYMNNNNLQLYCSETCFIPYVSCIRKYETSNAMLIVPFEKWQEF